MRRLPNPWVAIPVILAAFAGGAVGWFVTEASCEPGSCGVAAGIVAAVTGIGTAIGVGIVVVLAIKSLTEWRDHADREITISQERDGPPTC